MKLKKEKKNPGFKDMILRRIPEDVHRTFKSKCAQEGKGMTEKLIEYMRTEVAG